MLWVSAGFEKWVSAGFGGLGGLVGLGGIREWLEGHAPPEDAIQKKTRVFFFSFVTLGQELSDTEVYEP